MNPRGSTGNGDEGDADSHVRTAYASLAIALAGGFALAVWLPVQAALGRMDVSWLAAAQVHGHLQVIGFAGLFVLGVLTKVAPRFGGGFGSERGIDRGLLNLAFVSLIAGLVMRAMAQPFAEHPAFGALLAAGAIIEFVGTAAGALATGAVLWRAAIAGAPHAILILSGLGWWLLQAALTAGWCVGLAIDGQTILRGDRNQAVLVMQVYGFLLGIFAGVGLRSFPTFFSMPAPSTWLGRSAAALLASGVLAWSAGGLASTGGRDLDGIAIAGQVATGAGILVLVSATGWWRRKMRLAAASMPMAWPLRMTLVALTLTGLAMVVTAVSATIDGTAPSSRTQDAIRHLFTVGVVTQGIVVMAQLILPEFASERLVHRPGPWRSLALGLGLATAAILRGLLPLVGVSGATEWWLMAAGGSLAYLCVAAFAVLFVRARRTHLDYLKRVAIWRARPIQVREAPPGAP